jgi:hypothetical protein
MGDADTQYTWAQGTDTYDILGGVTATQAQTMESIRQPMRSIGPQDTAYATLQQRALGSPMRSIGPQDTAYATLQQRALGSAVIGGLGLSPPFRQLLDELVKSLVIDRCRGRGLPAFEAAVHALGYQYDHEECALYAMEEVRETKRVKIA